MLRVETGAVIKQNNEKRSNIYDIVVYITEKGGKVKEEEEEEGEAACVKCLRSHQPEWVILS